jgi:hypothetical protein
MTMEFTRPPAIQVMTACPRSWTQVVKSLKGYSTRGPKRVRLMPRESAAANQSQLSGERQGVTEGCRGYCKVIIRFTCAKI